MQIRILVVNDSSSDRLLIENMLKDYSVFTACNGVEAMRVLEENDGINLVILDLNRSNMDGVLLLKYLKEDQRFRKLRTILLIDYDEMEKEIKELKLDAIDYICKPIYMESLKTKIDLHIALIRAEQALEQQINNQTLTFEMFFEQAPIGISLSYSCDPNSSDDDIVRINSVYEKITGRTKEELITLGWAKITHPNDLEEELGYFRRLRAGEIEMYSMDKRYIKPDGSIVWAHVIVAPLTLPNVQHKSFICLIQDITKRKEIEKALYESERSKSVFFSHLPGLAYRCNYDHNWTMQYVSNGCFSLTGYPPESLLYNRDLSYNDIIAPEYRQVLWDEWNRILAMRETFKYEYEIITASGERKWVLEMGQGIYNDDGEVEALEGIVLDISDRKAIENTLKFNNEHDRWTGLYNREYLLSLLEKDIKLKKEYKKALIGINLSMVQTLVPNYGFQYSQNLIKKAAEALRQYCTDNRILFKPHDNRFVFYIYDYKDKQELIDFCNNIIKTLESLFITEGIGGGIGILEIDPIKDEPNIDLLLRRLLIASEKYVNFFGQDFKICFYDQELEAMVKRKRDITEALNVIALGNHGSEELFLQYQPILNLKTGKIFGFEALARIRTEKLGLVPPLEFIPVAEETKLIVPIGEIVLVKAFHFLKRLKNYGYNRIGISINISIIQLLEPNFTNQLFALTREMQVNPKNICFEITESVFASDYEKINNIIEKLKKAGFYIAIDDFGTGYSSLSRETELRADYVKIDKYFVDRLLNKNAHKSILGDIILIAHKLGHKIVAEGIEHEIQLHYLKKFKCDKIQGYYISKPLDEEDAIRFLENTCGKINI